MQSHKLENKLNIFFNLATNVALYESVTLYTRKEKKSHKQKGKKLYLGYYRLRKQIAFHEPFQTSEIK